MELSVYSPHHTRCFLCFEFNSWLIVLEIVIYFDYSPKNFSNNTSHLLKCVSTIINSQAKKFKECINSPLRSYRAGVIFYFLINSYCNSQYFLSVS